MWFVTALIIGAVLGGLFFWLRGRDIRVTWYEWLIGIVGVLLILFTIQNYAGALNEVKPTAANLFLLASGLPALILLAVAFQFVWRRNRAGD